MAKSKKNTKLTFISKFSKQQIIIALVFILGFGGFGVYKLIKSYAYTDLGGGGSYTATPMVNFKNVAIKACRANIGSVSFTYYNYNTYPVKVSQYHPNFYVPMAETSLTAISSSTVSVNDDYYHLGSHTDSIKLTVENKTSNNNPESTLYSFNRDSLQYCSIGVKAPQEVNKPE